MIANPNINSMTNPDFSLVGVAAILYLEVRDDLFKNVCSLYENGLSVVSGEKRVILKLKRWQEARSKEKSLKKMERVQFHGIVPTIPWNCMLCFGFGPVKLKKRL